MRMLIIIVVCYAIIWLPLHAINVIGTLDSSIYDQVYVHVLWLASHWLTATCCCINNTVFVCRSRTYRAFTVEILSKLCLMKKKQRSESIEVLEHENGES